MSAQQPTRGRHAGWRTYLPVGWLGLWLGSVVLVSALQPPDVEAVVERMLLWGWVGLWCLIFGLWYADTRRAGRPVKTLYTRLALVPPPRSAIAAAGGGHIRVAYLAFCIVVVGFATVLIWFSDEATQGRLLLGMIGFVAVVGLPMMVWALRSGYRDMAALLAPLGLAVTQTPEFLVVPGVLNRRARVYMEGAQVFAGERHGRTVGMVQKPGIAVTSVLAPEGGTLWSDPPPAPATAEQMAELTGEPASSFANVTVTTDARGVQVERRGNGAGRHFLIDLLLAEAIVGRKGEA